MLQDSRQIDKGEGDSTSITVIKNKDALTKIKVIPYVIHGKESDSTRIEPISQELG